MRHHHVDHTVITPSSVLSDQLADANEAEPAKLVARPTIMDPDDRQALIDLGLDPESPSLRAALDLVRWELQHFLGFDVTE